MILGFHMYCKTQSIYNPGRMESYYVNLHPIFICLKSKTVLGIRSWKKSNIHYSTQSRKDEKKWSTRWHVLHYISVSGGTCVTCLFYINFVPNVLWYPCVYMICTMRKMPWCISQKVLLLSDVRCCDVTTSIRRESIEAWKQKASGKNLELQLNSAVQDGK